MTLDLEQLGGLVWTQLWQVTAVIAAVGLATRLAVRGRPHLAHLLWLAVLVRCWIPPVWSSPTGIFSWGRIDRPLTADLTPVHRAPAVNLAGSKASGPSTKSARAVESPATASPTMMVSSDVDSSAAFTSALIGWCMCTAWLSGAALVVATATIRGIRWRRRVRAAASAVDPALESLVADLAAKLRLRRTPCVLITSLPVGPAVFGLLRPTVLLPEFIVADKSRGKLAAVLAHELVHLRRGDLPIGLFQLATQAAWWFHPLVWWAGRELARERERSCDEEVVAALRCEPAGYAQALLDVLKFQRRLQNLPAWPGMRPVEITRRRLEHIVARGASARARTPRRYWLVAGALLLLVAPGGELRLEALPAVAEEQEETPVKPPAEKPSDEKDGGAETTEIRRAIDRGITYLKAQQNDDGTWRDPPGYPGGITALCSLALLESGVTADDDALQRSLSQLRKLHPEVTYVAALTTLVICAAEPERDQRLIQRQAKWLADHQKQAGAMTGAWGYPQADGDNSNTGFALLALYQADRVDVHVEKDVWRRALAYWTSTQNPNGSWGYKPTTPGTGSMTCQGLICVAEASEVLDQHGPDQPGPRAIERASQWLGRNFSVQTNPGAGAQSWLLYYLHVLNRAGRLTARQKFGDHDWFAEGAKSLLESQAVKGGYWKRAGHAENDPVIATSLALLFLAHEKRLGLPEP